MQSYQINNNHVFHLTICVEMGKVNVIFSSIPVLVLNRTFPSFIATIKFSYVPNHCTALIFLNLLAKKIIDNKELHIYFYPRYMLVNGYISNEMAYNLIKMYDLHNLIPRTFYSSSRFPTVFFVISQVYHLKKNFVKRVGLKISRTSFVQKYLGVEIGEDESEFLLDSETIYLELHDKDEVESVLILDRNESLILFLNL